MHLARHREFDPHLVREPRGLRRQMERVLIRDGQGFVAHAQLQSLREGGLRARLTGLGDAHGVLHVAEVDIAQGAAQFEGGAADEGAACGQGLLPPPAQIEDKGIGMGLDQQGVPGDADEFLHQVVIRADDLGQVLQALRDARVDLCKIGQHLVAELVAEEGGVQVRAVEARR